MEYLEKSPHSLHKVKFATRIPPDVIVWLKTLNKIKPVTTFCQTTSPEEMLSEIGKLRAVIKYCLIILLEMTRLIPFFPSVHNEKDKRSGSGCSGSLPRMPCGSVTESEACYTGSMKDFVPFCSSFIQHS